MAESARETDDVSSAAVQLIQEAAREIMRRLMDSEDAHPAGTDTPQTHLLYDLDQFQECLEDLLAGEDPESVAGALPSTARPLSQLFRNRLLDTTGSEPAPVLEALRAVEALHRSGQPGRIPDPDADLKAWLTRPDAFELLVEVAHDLRSPLTSILFLSETIREGHSGELNDVQRSQLGLIYSAALGLISVTSNVVELAKDEKALVESADATAFSVAEVIHEVAQMVEPMAEEKGVELRVVAPERERGYGHPAALSRILLNLATNGLKFTEEGYVEVGAERTAHQMLTLWVRDTGRGIPEPQLRQLFQPFRRRLRDDSYFFSGSGLGLSICQRILKAMGSELRVETSPEWGTRFHFELETERRTVR